MSDFLMPALGADMEAGTLVEWLIKPGDRVKRGDVVAVVETQKGAIEVECFEAGIVSELVVPVGTKVPVGGVLAQIGESAAPSRPWPAAAPPSPKPGAAPAAAPPAPRAAVPVSPGTKVTPAARRRAAELGIDPALLTGTGVDGAVSLADVETAASSRSASPAPAKPRRTGFDSAEMRKAIAAAMARSKREIPHYYLSHTVDLGAALAWLEGFSAAQPVPQRLLPAALLLKASALALREVPQLNGTYADGAFRPGEGIHPGWAISLRGGGLVAPAIRDADSRPLPDLMAAMRDLVQRARSAACAAPSLPRRQSPSPASASAAPRASPASSTRRRSRSSASVRLRPGRGWSTER